MDLDRDGRLDIVSGSWPGGLYFFRRRPDGSFGPGELLKDKRGDDLNPGSASTVFAVDWDLDGDLDLLAGNIKDDVMLMPNESGGRELTFGAVVELVSLSDKGLGDSHPVAADWDTDGKLDVLVGHSEGGVVWCRNVGSAERPELSPPVELVPNSPSPWSGDQVRQPQDWGVRSKICVMDWNGDGRLDLLLGDSSRSSRGTGLSGCFCEVLTRTDRTAETDAGPKTEFLRQDNKAAESGAPGTRASSAWHECCEEDQV